MKSAPSLTPASQLRRALHDLRNDVALLHGGIAILSSASPDNLTPKQRQLVLRMEQRIGRMVDHLATCEDAAEHMVLVPQSPRGESGPRLRSVPPESATLARTAPSPGTRSERRTDPAERSTLPSPVARERAIPASELPHPGDVLDDVYQLEAVLAEGAMGVVYRARDLHLDRRVAVKVISGSAWSSESARELFIEEARALARIHHPNVVSIHALGTFRSNPYFVMELVEGVTLHDVIRSQRRPMPLHRAAAILEQVCQGLAAMHREGIVHRDLKPSNLLFGASSRVAIADLGLAVPLDSDRAQREGFQGGTPGYSPPEVFTSGAKPLTTSVDVYSLGAVAYELLTGKRAFEGDTPREIHSRQSTRDIVPIAELRPDLSPSVARLIHACLAPLPEERPQDVDAFARTLDADGRSSGRYDGIDVVVVDDDAETCDAMVERLRQQLPGCRVTSFTDALEALEAMTARPPDLILVDLEMPSLNGVELTATLRAESATSHVPVLVVTGVGSRRDWQLLHDVGADGFLVKPVESRMLGALARDLVSGSSSRWPA